MSTLKLAPVRDDEPTRHDTAMAAIERNWREWDSPNELPSTPWKPYVSPGHRQPALDVNKAVARATKVAVPEVPVPLWRRLLTRLRDEKKKPVNSELRLPNRRASIHI